MQAPKSRRPSARARHDEGRRAELLGEDDAVIAGVGLGHGRELARGRPVEAAAVDEDAADGDAVAAEELGGRMHDDVGAVLERPAQIGRGEGGIEHQRQLVLVRDVGHRLDVEHLEPGIAERLGEHQARLVGDGLARSSSGSRGSASVVVMPKRGSVCVNMLCAAAVDARPRRRCGRRRPSAWRWRDAARPGRWRWPPRRRRLRAPRCAPPARRRWDWRCANRCGRRAPG